MRERTAPFRPSFYAPGRATWPVPCARVVKFGTGWERLSAMRWLVGGGCFSV